MRLRFMFSIFICVLALNVITFAQTSEASKDPQSIDVEMTAYYIGFLRSGPNRSAEKTTETREIQRAHMAHIQSMAKTGKLVGAGPFGDDGKLRGIFIFKADSLDEVKAMAEADPAVKAGRLVVDLHPWLGPKGIGSKHAEERRNNPAAKDEMVMYQMALLGRGPKWTADNTPEHTRLQADHAAYIKQMMKSGRFVAAGPFTDGGEVRGIIVIQAATVEEAKALVESDPKVKAGHISFEIHPWWTAKGVMP